MTGRLDQILEAWGAQDRRTGNLPTAQAWKSIRKARSHVDTSGFAWMMSIPVCAPRIKKRMVRAGSTHTESCVAGDHEQERHAQPL